MNFRALLVVLLTLASSGAVSASVPPAAPGVVPATPPAVAPAPILAPILAQAPASAVAPDALAVAGELERLSAEQVLWPGFDPRAVPLAIFDGAHTWLFRHPAPPEGFESVEGSEPTAWRLVGRHPAVSANSSADLGGTSTATLMLEPMEADRSLTSLAAVAIHESFHVFQGLHPASFTGGDEGVLFTYPIEDARLAELRALETAALQRALDASKRSGMVCWARKALALRDQRFEAMEPEAAAYDRGTEVNEGLARYVQLRAEGDDDVIPADGYSAADVRSRCYATGAALALILDVLRPSWKDLFQHGKWGHLDGALQSALDAEREVETARCGFTVDESSAMARRARDDVASILTGRTESRIAFNGREGWRVVVEAAERDPLWPQGFDPLNVERVDGGVLHRRFLKLGNGSGQLEMLDGSDADVEALTESAGEHPLYNGIRRVVVACTEEPVVQSKGVLTSIEVPGITARFEGADVQTKGREIVVRLGGGR